MTTPKNLHIRNFTDEDWKVVSEIYLHGLQTRNATFETELPDFETWIKRFHRSLIWVALLDDQIAGWAGLQPVSARKVYEGVVEVTIYIHPEYIGNGIGKALMQQLITSSEAAGIWTLYASIFPENIASVRLHETNGFRKIGFRERIAKLDGQWRNTLLFERRSKIIGN